MYSILEFKNIYIKKITLTFHSYWNYLSMTAGTRLPYVRRNKTRNTPYTETRGTLQQPHNHRKLKKCTTAECKILNHFLYSFH